MSARADTPDMPQPWWDRLPANVQPRPQQADEPRGRLWRVETIALLLVFALLATATVNDLVRQAHINHRLVADLTTWRAYTRHNYKNVSVDQQTLGVSSKHDVVCGNTEPGPPNVKTQVCLVVLGPVDGGRRTVAGGWYLPPNTQDDVQAVRFGCFGPAATGRCPR